MKKLLFIFVFCFVFFACKEDDGCGCGFSFSAGSWTQNDTVQAVNSPFDTTYNVYSIALANGADSVSVTPFCGGSNRLAFSKLTSNSKIVSSYYLNSTPPDSGLITNLVITRISSSKFNYTFSESWDDLNPKDHHGSCAKN